MTRTWQHLILHPNGVKMCEALQSFFPLSCHGLLNSQYHCLRHHVAGFGDWNDWGQRTNLCDSSAPKGGGESQEWSGEGVFPGPWVSLERRSSHDKYRDPGTRNENRILSFTGLRSAAPLDLLGAWGPSDSKSYMLCVSAHNLRSEFHTWELDEVSSLK